MCICCKHSAHEFGIFLLIKILCVQACKIYTKAIALDSENSKLYSNRALCHEKCGVRKSTSLSDCCPCTATASVPARATAFEAGAEFDLAAAISDVPIAIANAIDAVADEAEITAYVVYEIPNVCNCVANVKQREENEELKKEIDMSRLTDIEKTKTSYDFALRNRFNMKGRLVDFVDTKTKN